MSSIVDIRRLKVTKIEFVTDRKITWFFFYFMHAPLLQAILHAAWLLPTLLHIILLCI